MNAALRVMEAFTNCADPDPADVAAVRAGINQSDLPIDEIASEVLIREVAEMKRRASAN